MKQPRFTVDLAGLEFEKCNSASTPNVDVYRSTLPNEGFVKVVLVSSDRVKEIEE